MSITNAPVSDNRSTVQEMVQRPQWLDEELYPFQSRFVEIDGNRVHYKAITISPRSTTPLALRLRSAPAGTKRSSHEAD